MFDFTFRATLLSGMCKEMPKISAETIRKTALINATIQSVGRAGSLDVTVAEIARLAGMSPALAHHYFGSKTRIFLAAMREILTKYRDSVLGFLKGCDSPEARLSAIIEASFSAPNFHREAIAAWLNFYALALIEPEAARLLRIYRLRLRSNLMSVLTPLAGPQAAGMADTLGALIDGVYLRAALSGDPDPTAAAHMVRSYLKDILP